MVTPPGKLRQCVVERAVRLFGRQASSHAATLRLGPAVETEERRLGQRCQSRVHQQRGGAQRGHSDRTDADIPGARHGLLSRDSHPFKPISRIVLGDIRTQYRAPMPAAGTGRECAVPADHRRPHSGETDIDAQGPLAHTTSDITP